MAQYVTFAGKVAIYIGVGEHTCTHTCPRIHTQMRIHTHLHAQKASLNLKEMQNASHFSVFESLQKYAALIPWKAGL